MTATPYRPHPLYRICKVQRDQCGYQRRNIDRPPQTDDLCLAPAAYRVVWADGGTPSGVCAEHARTIREADDLSAVARLEDNPYAR